MDIQMFKCAVCVTSEIEDEKVSAACQTFKCMPWHSDSHYIIVCVRAFCSEEVEYSIL